MVADEGGSHWNYNDGFPPEYAHDILIDETSLLYDILKRRKVGVNSVHQVIIKKDSVKGCRVCAVCPDDNTVCAVEFPENRFALGVKFHPELMCEGGFEKIFEAFVLACKSRR